MNKNVTAARTTGHTESFPTVIVHIFIHNRRLLYDQVFKRLE